MQRPQEGEYIPYYKKYITLVPDVPFEEAAQQNTAEIVSLFRAVPAQKHNYRYEQGKWSVKDVLMHIADTDRAISFRAMVAARGDEEMPLFTMEENLYAESMDLTDRSLESIIEEFVAVRQSVDLLLKYLPEEKTINCCNIAANMISVRALAYMMLGHAAHHATIIRERYL